MRSARPLRGADLKRPALSRLPEVDDRPIPGEWIARRAVTISLTILAVAVGALALASVLVTANVTVDGDGMLEPATVWPVRVRESGLLADIAVETGDTVVAGQVIASLDPLVARANVEASRDQLVAARIDVERITRGTPIERRRLEAALARATAQTARARASLRQRMVDFTLFGNPDSLAHADRQSGHVGVDGAAADFLAAEADELAARAQLDAVDLSRVDVARRQVDVRRLASELRTADLRLRRQAVVAPATGIVLTEQLERVRGTAVAAGETILELADISRWTAILAVGDHDVHRVHVGDRVDVEILSLSRLPSDHFMGRVRTVAWQPISAPSASGPTRPVGEYRVVVDLDSSDISGLGRGVLRRGFAVRGKVVSRSERLIDLALGYLRNRVRGIAR